MPATSQKFKFGSTEREMDHDSSRPFELITGTIGEKEFGILAKALKTNSSLTTLNLAGISIGDNGAQALSEAPHGTICSMRSNDNSVPTGVDYYYTTEPKDMSDSGYFFDGIIGYMYGGPTMYAHPAFHHWYNPTGRDSFYTHEYSKGETLESGYVYQGVVGYFSLGPDTDMVPLLRWCLPDGSRHFITTDLKGGMGPSCGYLFQGVAGYIYPKPRPITKPLFCWYYSQ
ncbi:hypothetical protein BGX26_002363 [Mortierella sp. AD094]|nr:hypothetical protein BGX26_002363 [Mortierella sp. AD094]